MSRHILLESLVSRIDAFMKERSWRSFHDQQSMLMGLSVEVGELMEHFLWHKKEDLQRVSHEKKEEISNEFADVFIALVEFALLCDIPIADAVEHKLGILERRYPAEEVSAMSTDQLQKYKKQRKKDGYQ